jgi:hypothetical protein
MGLLDQIKNEVKRSGTSKAKILFIKDGQKVRVRFLSDMDDGMDVKFHDSFAKSITVPCQEQYGKDCPHCEDEELRTRSQYVWSVWDYDAKEVKLFMYPVNNCSPVPGLVALYEILGTITDRDMVVSCSGKQQAKSFTIIPMDKVKFRNDKAKPYSEKAILKMIAQAYPCDDAEEEEEEEKPKRSKTKEKTSNKKKTEPEDDYDNDDSDNDEVDYSEMSPLELFKLCKERKIEVQPKKPAKYYIKQLEEYDEAQDDWSDDEGEEDDWED